MAGRRWSGIICHRPLPILSGLSAFSTADTDGEYFPLEALTAVFIFGLN